MDWYRVAGSDQIASLEGLSEGVVFSVYEYVDGVPTLVDHDGETPTAPIDGVRFAGFNCRDNVCLIRVWPKITFSSVSNYRLHIW